jgi:hypothetical protein
MFIKNILSSSLRLIDFFILKILDDFSLQLDNEDLNFLLFCVLKRSHYANVCELLLQRRMFIFILKFYDDRSFAECYFQLLSFSVEQINLCNQFMPNHGFKFKECVMKDYFRCCCFSFDCF